MALLVFINLGLIIAVLMYLVNTSYKRKINNQIGALGGEVLKIENLLFQNGPFSFRRKGETIYRIEYRIGTETKEGWVKFGGFHGPEWKL